MRAGDKRLRQIFGILDNARDEEPLIVVVLFGDVENSVRTAFSLNGTPFFRK